MAVAIDKGVVEQVHKFDPIDRSGVPHSRNPALPQDYFQPVVQFSKLDDDTKSLNLPSVCLQNNGVADWYHPSPITMYPQMCGF